MNAEYFTDTVNRLCERRPFRPFTLRFTDGSHFEVDSPFTLTAKNGLAVGFGMSGAPVWFDHDAVTKVDEDLASATEPSKD